MRPRVNSRMPSDPSRIDFPKSTMALQRASVSQHGGINQTLRRLQRSVRHDDLPGLPRRADRRRPDSPYYLQHVFERTDQPALRRPAVSHPDPHRQSSRERWFSMIRCGGYRRV